MRKIIFPISAAAIFLLGIIVGQQVTISHEKIDHSKVEYASQTDNKFYQKMISLERNTTLVFNGFPASLTGILFLKPGDEILSTETDTLSLVFEDLNRQDVNRYPYYVLKDNHNNIWSLYRHNDKFLLTREDETKYEKLLEIKTEKE